ncbi:acetyl-COA carboxylase [Pseudomonas oryzihabitans]|uniref:acetyl-CoA carboxylase n=1 Tax=Pseudomonas rhizoryzae TaxID=2571129 RepID=UPI00073667D0|nr:acetyl-CoA carboxylase [Pseudomonas rhizoryzae]APQ11277.1 acetyl-CoA carboxylase biotin carboxyl carrier protein subunit [Pseudomonas psychrotolerans]KTS77411.1 acetyl-COA carboxylase [Pseudomonas psychrotolerans]KTT03736.1 acetyl-COA carboxylase [Pseudomonas psychrotolerans]KTT10132.1 acetyl-COA carboxylase [Pseudomonas psychrotolerans]KTT26458.1 acetyl-COA carboxylase [Pseudomonas psychrotolerans]
MAEHNVQSPLPGTFYRKSAPDAPVYVEVGQWVEPGRVIGLIEVMKQFSEVLAERAGTLQAFLVEDGDPVEPGQALATISVDA